MSQTSTFNQLDPKEKLLLVATKAFAKHGLEVASSRDIATEADVNVSLINYHFGGKEGLYRACLERLGIDRLTLSERLLQPAKTKEEFETRLSITFDEMLRLHVEAPDECALIHNEMTRNFEDNKDIFENTFLKIFHAMTNFIESGQKSKFIRDDLSPNIVAMVMQGAILNVARTEKVRKKYFKDSSIANPETRAKIIEHTLTMFLEGILEKKV